MLPKNMEKEKKKMTNKEQLNELIPTYAFNKNELDSYKKLC